MKEIAHQWLKRIEQEIDAFKRMSCSELTVFLGEKWEETPEWDRQYLTALLVQKGCQGGIPFLLRQLESPDSASRRQALWGLENLDYRENRQLLINIHLKDPDEEVRATALISLSTLFRNKRDTEIVRLALAAFDDPASSVPMRLTAGAALVYQLDTPDELGVLPWWNEEETDLQHPALQWAVLETRRLLT